MKKARIEKNWSKNKFLYPLKKNPSIKRKFFRKGIKLD
jgi:hypothetical protein